MRKFAILLQRIVTSIALVLVLAPLAHSQGAQNPETRKAEEVYKNILVMRGTLASQMNQAMHLMESATGMDCEYCHIEGQFDLDVKPAKQVARQMILLMNDLNARYFGGRQVITCYSCHNGRPIPLNTPMFPIAKPPEPAELEMRTKIQLPPLDQILSRYVEALGGERALRSVTSRVVTGMQYIPTGPGGQIPTPATVERAQKAPNLLVNTYRTATYTIADGFDGSRAWSQNMQGRVTEPQSIDQLRARRDADFYLPLNLKQKYATMEVRGIERVNDRDAYLVVGVPEGDEPEQLYFDTQTGLLLRKVTTLPTPIGNSPFQVNYADYRDTGSGVKFPYLITMYPAGPRTVLYATATIRVTKVEENVPIEDSRFARPESGPTPR